MRVLATGLTALGWVAIAYLIFLNGSYAFLLVASTRGLNQQRRRERYADYGSVGKSHFTPPISVILPAFNEERSVADSVEALRKLDYPVAEIIVVNDGSSDGTLETLIATFRLRPADRIVRTKEPAGAISVMGRLRGFYAVTQGRGLHDLLVVDKENGGKADALNAGIAIARFPLCATVDADSLLEQDSLLRGVRPFVDDPVRTIAVGGLVRIANGSRVEKGRVTQVGLPMRMLALAQIVEYFRAFLGTRFGMARIGSLLILSGAFSIFRRTALLEVGGFRNDVLTEDMEIICALHRKMRERPVPYSIAYIPDPIAWTEAPSRLVHLRRQRTRWHRGLLQVLALHRHMMLRPRYGVVGLFAFPYHVLFEGLGPVVEVAGYVLVPLGWAFGLVDATVFLVFLTAAVGYGVVLSAFAIFLQTRSRLAYERGLVRLLVAALFEATLFRPLIALYRAIATAQHLARRGSEWGAQARSGFDT